MALTAMVTPEVETEVNKLLRNHVVTKASINQPNISLSAKELKVPSGTFTLILADLNSQLCTQIS